MITDSPSGTNIHEIEEGIYRISVDRKSVV